MNIDTPLRVIDTILQFALVIFAGLALSVWKKEIRGKDKYKLAKDLLIYIRELRFLVHSRNGSHHQIYLNDILVDRGNFFKDQLLMIKDEMVYFDQSIWSLFSHINTRSDILLPKRVRRLLEDLCPRSGNSVGSKNQYTYIHIGGVGESPMINLDSDEDSPDSIFHIHGAGDQTIREYFEQWEKLIVELQKSA